MSNSYPLKIILIGILHISLSFYSSVLWGVTSEAVLSGQEEVTVIGEELKVNSGPIDAPVKIEVMSKEHLQKQQYQNLAEAITELPGVSTIGISRRAGGSSALIQGFGENSVLVMIDGTPVSQSSSFGFDLSQVPINTIESVEVIKGAASAMYGNQAMGGVINIVTKKAGTKKRYSAEFSNNVTLKSEAGSKYEGQKQNASVALTGEVFKNIGTKFDFSFSDQDAIELDPKSITFDSPAYQKINSSITLDKRVNQTHYFANYSFFNGRNLSRSSRPYSSSTFGPSINKTDTISHNSKLGLDRETENGDFRGLVNFEQMQDSFRLNDNPATSFTETLKTTKTKSKRVDLVQKDFLLNDHKFTFGILYKEDTVDQQTRVQVVEDIIVNTNDIKNKKINSYEAYVQDTFFVKNLEVSPGVRVQYNADFASNISPKLNLNFYKEIGMLSSKTWFSVGTGYRVPSVKERFFTLDHSSVANYIVEGNDELVPEKSISFQLGEELRLSSGSSLYSNLFFNDVKGLIESEEIESDASMRKFTYKNIEEVYSYGVELGSKFQLLKNMKLRVNYTYSKIQNRRSKKILQNRPLYTSHIAIENKLSPNVETINQFRYFGAKYRDEENTTALNDYVTWDFKLNWKFSKLYTGYFAINNLFNSVKVAAQDLVNPIVDDRLALGRSLLIGVRLSNE